MLHVADTRVTVESSGCMTWSGPKTQGGYGMVSMPGIKSPQYVHRVAYERAKGPIPEGLQIDHLCRNRACCNPSHLEAVTARVNVLRGTSPAARNILKTHCANGHEYTPENTRRAAGAPNKRKCRTCSREACRRYQARLAAARA